MLWGGISYQGLFPKQSPIFVDDWLELIRPKDTEKANEELGDLRYIIFQDDQDRQQRMRVALDAVEHVFHHWIEPKDCAAKLADVWPIENVW
ncbi:unnamed protein product, partial [Rotaria sp. Silwood1]